LPIIFIALYIASAKATQIRRRLEQVFILLSASLQKNLNWNNLLNYYQSENSGVKSINGIIKTKWKDQDI